MAFTTQAWYRAAWIRVMSRLTSGTLTDRWFPPDTSLPCREPGLVPRSRYSNEHVFKYTAIVLKKKKENYRELRRLTTAWFSLQYFCWQIRENINCVSTVIGGAVASWLLRSTPDQAVLVWTLAGENCIVFSHKTVYSHSASLHSDV